MLDFGFSEILLTSAIALVVLGPERLPKVARRVGNWMGRARLMARQLSEQLEREVNAEALLREQTKMNGGAERTAKSPPTATASADVPAALSAGTSAGGASSAAAPEQTTATDPKHP
jgi:sec-independent protein translocase protein TatB